MPIDASIYGQQVTPRFNTPFDTLQQVLSIRNQQQAAQGLQEQRAAIAEQRQAQTADLQRKASDYAALNDALSRATTQEEAAKILRDGGHGALLATMQEHFAKADELAAAARKAKQAAADADRAYLGGMASFVNEWAKDGPDALMNAWKIGVEHAKGEGHDTSQWEAVVAKDPTQLPRVLNGIQKWAQGPQKPAADYTLGNQRFSGETNQPVATAAPETPKLGSDDDFVRRWATERRIDPSKLSAGQVAAALREKAAAGGEGAKPYFTYQPVFDTQGRPISAIRFDARGGPPQVVDVSALTGGGQLKPPPGTTGQQSVANEVSSVQLGRLREMFDKGAKDLIGPVEGRARAVGQGLPGVPVNQAFSDFKAATDAFKNSVIKAITGAQMSEPEAKRIIGQIPTENDKPEVWMSKYQQTMNNLGDLEKVLSKKGGGSDLVDMVTPDGRPMKVPKSDVARMEGLGAKRR